MTIHKYSGIAKWAKVFKPDEKYEKYAIDMLLDMEQYNQLKSTGIKNNGKPEGDKMWVTFRRNKDDNAPTVIDADGNAFTDTIGNGSEVSVKVDIETFTSKKYGKVTKSMLDTVRIDKLVKYEKDQPSTGKPKIMF